MITARLWIAVLAVVSFAAGLACGVWVNLASDVGASVRERTPFYDYEQLLIEEFQLSSDRARGLHGLLHHYHRDIERHKDSKMSGYLASIEPELRELSLRYHGMIRERVIPLQQRDRFDRMCTGTSDSE